MGVCTVGVTEHDTLTAHGHITLFVYDAASGELVEVIHADNLVTMTGKNLLLHYLANDGTMTAGAQYLAIGTGVGTPALGDTALFTEVLRTPIIQTPIVSGTVTLTGFIPTTQGNVSWTELGIYGNGATATPGSGFLLTHALLAYTKTSSYNTVIAYMVSV